MRMQGRRKGEPVVLSERLQASPQLTKVAYDLSFLDSFI